MYLHIGNGNSIKKRDVIGIFDLDTATVSNITKKFISSKEKLGLVDYTDQDLPRSFIIICDGGNEKIKLSRISTSGLRQRIEGEQYSNLSK